MMTKGLVSYNSVTKIDKMPFTQEQLNKKVEECFDHAVDMLNKQGEINPMLDIEFEEPNGKQGILAIVLVGDDRARWATFVRGIGLLLSAIKRMGKIKDVRGVVILSEGWFSSVGKEDYEKGNFTRPSLSANRREMLMVAGLTENGIQSVQNKEIFRVEVKGKKYFNLQGLDYGKFQGAEIQVLKNFFDGYGKVFAENDPRQLGMEAMLKATNNFDQVDLDTVLKMGVEKLTKIIGGDSEYIPVK